MKSRVVVGIVAMATFAMLLSGCGEKKTPGNGMGPTDSPVTISGNP